MVAYQAADNSELSEKAKIYGKKGKPLTKHQIAINEAAANIAKENPLVVLDKGWSYCQGFVWTNKSFLTLKNLHTTS